MMLDTSLGDVVAFVGWICHLDYNEDKAQTAHT